MQLRKRGYSGTTDPSVSSREEAHRVLARRAAAEGMVLLKNDGCLPLQPGTAVALYGMGARYTVKGGTGSGSVNNRENVSVDAGLRYAGLRITTDRWLDSFDAAYAVAKQQWMEKIYAQADGKNPMTLYGAHASTRLETPQGEPFEKTDADIAIYVISRISGESRDRRAEKGDYYLSDTEENDLKALGALYPKLIVVLNTGGVMDLSFLDTVPVSALVLMSQAGMEGGNALADVLTGAVPFSGKLTDTWPMHYEDYPTAQTFGYRNNNLVQEKYTDGIYVGYRYFDSFQVEPRFPFGFGLTCTEFSTEALSLSSHERNIQVQVRVTNTGSTAGREVAQLYAACPQQLRQKERRRLVAFAKTKLLQPGQSQELTLTFAVDLLASYHTGRAQYYMEAGKYALLLGSSSRDNTLCALLTLDCFTVTRQLTNICPLLDALTEIRPCQQLADDWQKELEAMSSAQVPPLALEPVLQRAALPECTVEDDAPYAAIAEDIMRRMAPLQKARLCCGQPSTGSRQIVGSAALHVPGAAGETTGALEEEGIGIMVLADGPAGIRLQQRYEVDPRDGSIQRMDFYQSLENRFFGKEFLHPGCRSYYQFCSAIPVGTLLAQSFDVDLLEEVGALIGREMKEFGVTLWLAPGMNIHRNALCGRNFEYYSEDPLVSGLIAAAITRGVQRYPGIGTTIKHFACNNQEDNRMGVSSVVSERALREIYLKGFEIAVTKAQPMAIMTSYNRLNSVHTANSYDLCTTVARGEWGFRGIIMTDWCTTNRDSGSSAVKCLQAGNDLIMPGNESDIMEILDALEGNKDLYLKQEELDRCVKRMLIAILRSDVYEDARPFAVYDAQNN